MLPEFLSGLAGNAISWRSIIAGFDYHFVKPMHADDPQHFLEKIAKREGDAQK
jgi:hypothetical protein